MFLNSTEVIDDILIVKAPEPPPKGTDVWGNITRGINTVLNTYNRQRRINENFERARQGRTPIVTRRDTNVIPNIQIDDNTRNTGLMIAAGVGAVLLIMALNKGD